MDISDREYDKKIETLDKIHKAVLFLVAIMVSYTAAHLFILRDYDFPLWVAFVLQGLVVIGAAVRFVYGKSASNTYKAETELHEKKMDDAIAALNERKKTSNRSVMTERNEEISAVESKEQSQTSIVRDETTAARPTEEKSKPAPQSETADFDEFMKE